MYADNFFRHTNNILKLMRSEKLIAPGARTEATNLKGGFWNKVMHLRAPYKNWIVKQFNTAAVNPLFPNLPDAEAQALQDLSGLGIAPNFVRYIPDAPNGPVLIYDFHEGESWSVGAERVGALFSILHDHDIGTDYRSLPIEPKEILAEASLIMEPVADTSGDKKRLEALRPTAIPHPGLTRRSLVHTDTGPGNLIDGEQGLQLIDWQCPGMGDPVEDLACFASPGIQILYDREPLTAEALTGLLDGYGHPETCERFHLLRAFYHFRLASYFIYRRDDLRQDDEKTSALYHKALEAELVLLEALQ